MNEKTYIDVSYLYSQLQAKGHSITRKSCCGKNKKRTDYINMLNILNMHGSFVIKSNGIVVASVTV